MTATEFWSAEPVHSPQLIERLADAAELLDPQATAGAGALAATALTTAGLLFFPIVVAA